MELLRCNEDAPPQEDAALLDACRTIATFPRPAVRGLVSAVPGRKSTGTSRVTAGMVGESAAMRPIFDQIRLAAATDVPVMITGESGTGKELAARALHDLGPRRQGPFGAVNCGAIPANLAEAELLGYEKGAFTGAVRQHVGHFERSHGGTLFLDEITEMPHDLQVKLLRVVESGRFTRVGGVEEVAVDVRLVAATNRDPYRAMHEGRLREDLLYRLAVFPLCLPALRERGEDVVRLARHFLDRLNEKYAARKRFSARALGQLRTHHWPGNVRELRNCIERSFILAADEIDLEIAPARRPAPPGVDADGCVRVPMGATLAEAERVLILATIEHCGGNKRKAADVLGISVKTIYNKLTEYAAGDVTAGHAGAH